MSDDHRANLRMIYTEVAESFHRVDDFRVRLLALLPLFSGAGIFLMLDSNFAPNFASDALPYIGLFGAVATLGLFIYELRGIRRCNILVRLGQEFEYQLGVVGPFAVKSKHGLIGATAAAFVVYATVLGGWIFLATSQCDALMAAKYAAGASFVLLASSITLQLCGELDPELKSAGYPPS